MKKRFYFLAATLALAISLLCPSFAFADSTHSYVFDEAHLLSEDQALALEEKAAEISEKYECGLYILTVENFQDATSSGRAYTAATQLYQDRGLGLGDQASGQLLMLSMSERDYALIAHGYGSQAITEYGNQYICDKFLDDFADDDWYAGFEDYLTTSARLLKDAADGKPFDKGSATPMGIALAVLVCILISLVISWFILHFFKSQLKSVHAGGAAEGYVTKDGLNMTVSTDQYTHTTQTRVYIEPAKSSSGGSTSRSSGGFSGSSGKF